MKHFAILLECLLLTQSRNQKIAHMVQYFKDAPDPDRGYALAVLTGELNLAQVKSKLLKDIVLQRIDETLFALSYDYVGDLAETIALIWPENEGAPPPDLTTVIRQLETLPPRELPPIIMGYLSGANPSERWALMKLVTGNLRVGVSARLVKTALADFGGKTVEDIEHVWHGLQSPYEDLFQWLEGKGPVPEIHHHKVFHPLMLSNPIDEEKDFKTLNPEDYQAEWKWDGIRVQIVLGEGDDETAIFSRTGDNIGTAFPDLVQALKGTGVLDGELLVGKNFEAASFNDLQQRLNRKTVSQKMLTEHPSFIRLYDILFDGNEDVRGLPLSERRLRLENWIARHPNSALDISDIISFTTWEELGEIRARGAEENGHEGVMMKRKDSIYVPGRPRGPWFKWKRDPCLIDAVLMYAQRGHGKRSSFYSDYTFGLWENEKLLPIGKAYFGFTDQELVQIDKWVRGHTLNRYGPVREVDKELVFEVAFDSAQLSKRHRSGVALRFPRIHRIRWDKPAAEADQLSTLQTLIERQNINTQAV